MPDTRYRAREAEDFRRSDVRPEYPWDKTKRGRVVYDRPKKNFTSRDVLRIVQKTQDNWKNEPGDKEFIVDRIRIVRDIAATWLLTVAGVSTRATKSILQKEVYDIGEGAFRDIIENMLEVLTASAIGTKTKEAISESMWKRAYELMDKYVDSFLDNYIPTPPK